MADTFLYVQNQPSTLAGAGTSIGDTSIILTSLTRIDGTLLTMADFGTIGFGTIEPGNGIQEEQICWTGVTQNSNGTATLTGAKSVLTVSPYTQTSGLATSHAGGTQFVVSNTAGFYDKLTAKGDDETITGTYTFTNPNYPQMDTATPYPTTGVQLATKAYADSLAIAGAPNASTSVQGLVQEATQAQTDAKTATGSTGAKLFQNLSTQRSTLTSDYVADTGAADAYAIAPSPAITAYTPGQQFTFKATNANTTTSTLNVSALGVKTIKKLGNTTNLIANDILANQMVLVEYDGTDFQMLSPSGKAPVDLVTNQTIGGQKSFSGTAAQFTNLPQSAATPSSSTDLTTKAYVDAGAFSITTTNGTTTKNSADASATQTIAHGLGRTPKKVRIVAVIAGATTPYLFNSQTVYNGTTQSSVSLVTGNAAVISLTTDFRLNADNSVAQATNNAIGVVTVDGTNISIAWTKTGNPTGTYTLLWETA